MKNTIQSESLLNLNEGVNAAELVTNELAAYRTSAKLNGYAVIYEEGDVAFFRKKSSALLGAVNDLTAWVKIHGGSLRIFTNANGEAAIEIQS